MSRMMTYAWFDRNHRLAETKFGDHFVEGDVTLQQAIDHTLDYMRGQFPRRARYFDTDQVLKKVWDVSDVARDHKRFYPRSHIDDVIGATVGRRGTKQGGEFHDMLFDDLVLRVNRYINKTRQPRPQVYVTPWQHDAAVDLIDAMSQGKAVTLAELCARFGKTIWAGVVAIETGSPLTVVASYVLTSFASFAKDLTEFQQFRHMEIIDSAEPDYQQQISDAISRGRQAVVFLSMVGGGLRQDRIDYIFDLPVPRLVFIDEADYGAHTSKQTEPFIAARKENDRVVLMTGTNGERACGDWQIDHYLGTTYPELLVERSAVLSGTNTAGINRLKQFAIDPSRSQLVVPVEFYQMDVQSAVDYARRADPELFVDGDDFLPSWSKFARDPLRAKGFWTRMLEAVFLGQNNMPEIDVDRQVGKSLGSDQVAMMFLPGSMTNENLKVAVELTEQTLKGWQVLEISGAGTYNGKKITNKNAEKITNAVLERCRESRTPLLIISRGMAQRSYSIGDITSLFLCYDNGDAGATTQKISRALTPSHQGKIGRIFSLSFDPNRDDKFDTMLIAAAQNIAKHKDMEIDAALRKVIDTIDIFSCGRNGSSLINPDQYLQQILGRNSLTRMIGQQADLSLLSMQEILALANGNGEYDRMNKVDPADRGKVGIPKQQSVRRELIDKTERKLLEKARLTLINIVENLPYLAVLTGAKSIRESLQACDLDLEYQQYIQDEFGLAPLDILHLFDRGVLNYDLAALQKDAKLIDLATSNG